MPTAPREGTESTQSVWFENVSEGLQTELGTAVLFSLLKDFEMSTAQPALSSTENNFSSISLSYCLKDLKYRPRTQGGQYHYWQLQVTHGGETHCTFPKLESNRISHIWSCSWEKKKKGDKRGWEKRSWLALTRVLGGWRSVSERDPVSFCFIKTLAWQET